MQVRRETGTMRYELAKMNLVKIGMNDIAWTFDEVEWSMLVPFDGVE